MQYCDKVGTNGAHTAVTSRAGLDTTAKLTPDEVNRAVTLLKKLKAKIDGKVHCHHPPVRRHTICARPRPGSRRTRYAGLTELFTGEIGELHGVRFIETTEAKIFNGEGCPVKTEADESGRVRLVYYSVYATLFLGKRCLRHDRPRGRQSGDDHHDKVQVGRRSTSSRRWATSSPARRRSCDEESHGACGELRRVLCRGRGKLRLKMETGASRSPEKTGQEGRIVMENAFFASMETITLPRAGGTEQQSVFVCVNGRTFQVPRGKAVEVPEPVYEVLENARRQLEAARKLEG